MNPRPQKPKQKQQAAYSGQVVFRPATQKAGKRSSRLRRPTAGKISYIVIRIKDFRFRHTNGGQDVKKVVSHPLFIP
jgi:hypothetical protein